MNERLVNGLTGRVLVITGSGISADSGIPTFRGEGGYWRTYRAEDLATPAAFDHDPKLVWEWYRERRATVAAAQPNPSHMALVSLAQRCREFFLITQNVDDLHERASVDGQSLSMSELVHIHGEIFRTRCTRCDYSVLDREMGAGDDVPRCPVCNSLSRPGVVWFGEQLGESDGRRVEEFLRQGECDLVLVVGTTATFGYIQRWALAARGHGGWLVEINPHETSMSGNADQVIRENAATVLPGLVAEAFGLGR